MATTPEGKVKAAVKKLLDHHKVRYFMPVQTGFGRRDLDFIVCANGHYLTIETKATLDDDATQKQKQDMRDVRAVNGVTFVIAAVDDPRMAHLESFLVYCDNLPAPRSPWLVQYTTEPEETKC